MVSAKYSLITRPQMPYKVPSGDEDMDAKKGAAPAPEMQEQRNMNWAIHILPEDCRSLFVCMDGEIFDKWVKNGAIPLHDGRASKSKVLFNQRFLK